MNDVARQPRAVADEIDRLQQEIDELNSLFDLQHSRTSEADQLYVEEHPRDDCPHGYKPDLGTLVGWLMDERKRLQADLDALQETLAGVKSMHADALEKNVRLQAIVDGAEAASRGDYVVEYGWNRREQKMGYWWGPRGSFGSDRMTWAGVSVKDAWLAIGVKAAKRTRAT